MRYSFVLLMIAVFMTFDTYGRSEPALLNEKVLPSIMELHGLTHEEAIDRIRNERELDIRHQALKQFLGPSYAGAWMEGDPLTLYVAVADKLMLDWVKVGGARPVLVEFGLSDLQEKAKVLLEVLDRRGHSHRVVAHYPDFRLNEWVVEVEDEIASIYSRDRLSRFGIDPSGLLVIAGESRSVSMGVRRAGEAIWNYDTGETCTAGFNVDHGFLMAAHCGNFNDRIYNSDLIGWITASDWPYKDRALVGNVVHGWSFVPEVYGYTSPNVGVNGAMPATVGVTACRYGQASGGSHCGKITHVDRSETIEYPSGTYLMTGLIRADICGIPGDSGSPLITPSGEAQGINIAGKKDTPCPNGHTLYEPVLDALYSFGSTLLTVHGGTNPHIVTFKCPDFENSGQQMYVCGISYYTQGSTSVSWSSNTSGSGGDYGYFGSCVAGTTVNINVTVTNSWGSDFRQAWFPCPSGPIP